MGVQRKSAQVNWLASFGLIILAGTLYRIKKINNVLFKTQMKEIMQKVGLRFYGPSSKTILTDLTGYKKGEWQETLLRSNQYKFCQRIHKLASQSQTIFKKKEQSYANENK